MTIIFDKEQFKQTYGHNDVLAELLAWARNKRAKWEKEYEGYSLEDLQHNLDAIYKSCGEENFPADEVNALEHMIKRQTPVICALPLHEKDGDGFIRIEGSYPQYVWDEAYADVKAVYAESTVAEMLEAMSKVEDDIVSACKEAGFNIFSLKPDEVESAKVLFKEKLGKMILSADAISNFAYTTDRNQWTAKLIAGYDQMSLDELDKLWTNTDPESEEFEIMMEVARYKFEQLPEEEAKAFYDRVGFAA